MAQETEKLCKKRVKRVENLYRNLLIYGDFKVFDLRFYVSDFHHEFLDILTVTMSNFLQLLQCVPFRGPVVHCVSSFQVVPKLFRSPFL